MILADRVKNYRIYVSIMIITGLLVNTIPICAQPEQWDRENRDTAWVSQETKDAIVTVVAVVVGATALGLFFSYLNNQQKLSYLSKKESLLKKGWDLATARNLSKRYNAHTIEGLVERMHYLTQNNFKTSDAIYYAQELPTMHDIRGLICADRTGSAGAFMSAYHANKALIQSAKISARAAHDQAGAIRDAAWCRRDGDRMKARAIENAALIKVTGGR